MISVSDVLFPFNSFIENYGTHIVTSATIGGRDVVYIRQHQSSPLSVSDIENYVKDIGDQRFSDSKVNASTGTLKYKDKVSKAAIFKFTPFQSLFLIKIFSYPRSLRL